MLEGTSGGPQSNLLPKAGLVVVPGQVAEGFIHLGLETPQGCRWHNLSGQPALQLGCPLGEKVSP